VRSISDEKIAEDNMAGPVRDGIYPVVERMPIMQVKFFALLFHFEKQVRLPD
jgi:hypothetical protein